MLSFQAVERIVRLLAGWWKSPARKAGGADQSAIEGQPATCGPTTPTTASSDSRSTRREGRIATTPKSPLTISLLPQCLVTSRCSLADRCDYGFEEKTTLTLLHQFLRDRGIDPESTPIAAFPPSVILEFVERYARRLWNAENHPLSAPTVLELIGHLREFLTRDTELEAQRRLCLISNQDLRLIFDPTTYLRFNSSADRFWLPLLGLFTGAHLEELLKLRSMDVRRDSVAGVWVMDLCGRGGKGGRTVPLPQTLIELGFMNYVYATRRLLDQPLFPNRQTTGIRVSSSAKHASRVFGKYLAEVGLSDCCPTFDTLRHTAIYRMHFCGVPIANSEGTTGQATPADDAEPELSRLKRVLDCALIFELNYPALRKAAAIVQEHTRWVDAPRGGIGLASRWVSGWRISARLYANRQVLRLGQTWTPPPIRDNPSKLEEVG